MLEVDVVRRLRLAAMAHVYSILPYIVRHSCLLARTTHVGVTDRLSSLSRSTGAYPVELVSIYRNPQLAGPNYSYTNPDTDANFESPGKPPTAALDLAEGLVQEVAVTSKSRMSRETKSWLGLDCEW